MYCVRKSGLFCLADILCLLLSYASVASGSEVDLISQNNNGALSLTQIPPSGPRNRVLLKEVSPPITCRSCDLNYQREIKMGNYTLWIADSAILVFQSCDTQCIHTQTLDFDSSVCFPSYLQPSAHDPHRAYVVCSSRPRILSISYSEITGNFGIKRPYQGAKGEFALTHGVVASGNAHDLNGNDDYLIWIASDRRSIGVYAFYGLRQIPNMQTVPLEDAECDVFEALYPMDATPVGNHPRFLLQCTKSSISKLYEITLDFVRETLHSREVPSSVGSPVASPGSAYLCLQTNLSITIYRTDDYSQYRPKSFDGPIVAAYFVQSDVPNGTLYLIVIRPGRNITVIAVADFYNNPNSGVVSVPESAANCAIDGSCLPQKIFDHNYLVIVKDGSAWKAHIYRLDSLTEPPTVIPDIDSQPEIAFLQPGPVRPTMSSSSGSSTDPAPSSTDPAPSYTPSPSPGSVTLSLWVKVGISLGIFAIAAAAGTLLVCIYWRKRNTGKYLRKKNVESPSISSDSDSLSLEQESESGAKQSSPEAEKVNQKPSAIALALVKADANYNLDPDKSLAETETHEDPLNLSHVAPNTPVTTEIHKHAAYTTPPTFQPEQPRTTVTKASTPRTDNDRLALPKPEHTNIRSDRESTLRRATHLLTPQPNRRHQTDSGVNSSSSSLSSANSTSSASISVPSQSSDSLIGSRSNTPDGCSLPGDRMIPTPTQVSNSRSSGRPPQLVAPQFGPTSL